MKIIKQNIFLDTYRLKIIAIISMTIDHIGVIFFPTALWMRIIGRIAFPIFAFLISEGFLHTKNLLTYEKRLFLFALISVPAYYLAFGSPYNVFFTLFCGLLSLHIDRRVKNNYISIVYMLLLCAITYRFDWGVCGVIAIYIFGKIKNRHISAVIGVCACIISYLLEKYIFCCLNNTSFIISNYKIIFYQFLAVIPIMLYNGQRGKNSKMFFYIYYPLHLIVLSIINMLS